MSVSNMVSSAAPRRGKRRKPINLGIVGGILLMPILMIAALVSIPYTWTWRAIVNRKERRFTRKMKSIARVKAWSEVEQCLAEKTGTFVAESLSMKGPSRLWWTVDKISEISPFSYASAEKRDRVCYEMEFRPFGNWCFHRYTSPRSGKAFLVEVPPEQSLEIWKKVTTAGCVSTYSRKAWKA